jgi:endonuclease YncB( thermonuclease family)
MPFTLLAGTYHLVGRNGDKPVGLEPDGDSIHFKPRDPQLLARLERVGGPAKVNAIGSLQLRFEGVDAPELHFGGSRQSLVLGSQARDFVTGELGLNPVPYESPGQVRVKPPVAIDGTPGFVLSRALDPNGRPVAFAFAGPPPDADDATLTLDAALLRRSLNFGSIAAGHAYPLFYDTLFADLREALAAAVVAARDEQRGLWRHDRSDAGLDVGERRDLEADDVIFPKLFRRLIEFLGKRLGDVSGFPLWLGEQREQVLDLSTSNFTHFDNLVAVEGNRVRLTRHPEQLVFISAKTDQVAVAPWLDV